MKVRRPVVAGLFYESGRERLLKQLDEAFLKGPGGKPRAPSYTGKVIGIVAPHAGYVYSGYVAAYGYFELANGGIPETVVLLGPNHHGIGLPVAISEADAWETPLGVLEVDKELAKRLVEWSGVVAFDEGAHKYEHSLEVQLPFLQYTFGEGVKIVPISMYLQNLEVSRRLGHSISRVLTEMGVKAYVIASSDFTHYEEASRAVEKDKAAIDAILRLDDGGFYDVVIEKDVSACGIGAIMTLVTVARDLTPSSSKLLKYANSGDVTGDYSSVVGYASIAFYRG
ncbi:MAG: MEMO1 family protein [Thermofilaceae archaeon]|nr:MEMO1 family protein [Thermofilaceae archaeon]MCX8181112.1 MEMO1 family protein [Thermofilaceae archaeon]MDW8004882.1 MEMO1 family protein [Thermofilaceae archaeon]